MKHRIAITAMMTSAALALTACGSEDVENTPVDDIDEIVDADNNQTADDAYPVGDTLDEDQQARFDAMDRQAVSDEYDTNRDAMNDEMDSNEGAMGSDTMAGGASEDGSSGTGGDGMTGGSGGESMMPRSQMDFAYLDRNDDGQLSVAEYAIWALPTDPSEPEPNDAKAPYLTQSQINEAGETFFYFDEDGDSYLSQAEFQAARNSARTP
ncbi:hypothetical protein AAG612_01420 [Citromicrobium bathyomarinum]|uniref:hypothetical protein n=1 Tax=Citromicrobium bathyomarinum TaxID=72174 RepID=UPI00315B0B93